MPATCALIYMNFCLLASPIAAEFNNGGLSRSATFHYTSKAQVTILHSQDNIYTLDLSKMNFLQKSPNEIGVYYWKYCGILPDTKYCRYEVKFDEHQLPFIVTILYKKDEDIGYISKDLSLWNGGSKNPITFFDMNEEAGQIQAPKVRPIKKI